MYFLPPLAINEDNLTSSTVAEPDTGANETAWARDTLYHAGEELYLGLLSHTVTISNGSPALVTWANNGLAVGARVVFTVAGGSLPTGITSGRVYYVRKRVNSDSFYFSKTKNGRVVSTTSAGSGTFTCKARIHKVYQALQGATSVVTLTIASPCVVTVAGGITLAENTKVVLTNAGGALPTGLTAGFPYYVLNPDSSSSTCNLALTAGGAAINTTGSQSGVHTGGLAVNYNADPMLNPTVWEEVGSTNKWAKYDDKGGSYTEDTSNIVDVITPGVAFDGLSIRGANGGTVNVKLTNGGATTYWDYTFNLSTEAMTGGATWMFYRYSDLAPTDGQSETVLYDLALVGLETHAAGVLTVTITTASGTARVGKIRIGTVQDLGLTVSRPGRGIIDYSPKTSNSRGVTTLEEGVYKRRLTAEVLVGDGDDEDDADDLTALLETYRARTGTWIPSARYGNLMIHDGFLRSWEVSHAPVVATLQVEGL